MNYIEIISQYYPTVGCHIQGDPNIYENIIYDSGDPIPEKTALDNLLLEAIKNKIWDNIKSYRDNRKFGGIYVSSKWFHNDADSRTQWLGLKDKARDALANSGTTSTILTLNHPQYGAIPISWTTMDGSGIVVTVQLAFDVVEKTGDLDGILYGLGQYHKGQLYASNTPETYNYTTLWPAVYGE